MNKVQKEFIRFLERASEIDRFLDRNSTYYHELVQNKEELQEIISYFSTSEIVSGKLASGKEWLCIRINPKNTKH